MADWSVAIGPVEAEYVHTPYARPCRRLSFQRKGLRASALVFSCGTAFAAQEYRAGLKT